MTLALGLVATAAFPAAAGAAVTPLAADLEGGLLSEFSQASTLNGSLTTDTTRAYEGTHSARAHYPGGTDNAYQRGVWNVDWHDGDDVWYSSAFFLPVGFKANMRGQVDLMRWDNWPTQPTSSDWGGLVIWNSDKKMRLMRFNAAGQDSTLVGPLEIPEGRWVHLEVHQRLNGGAGAVSEVFLDGQLLGSSTQPNTYGRSIQRLRTGIVAIGAGSQTQPLTLWFDRTRVSATRQGPLGGVPAEPVVTEPAPTPPPVVTAPVVTEEPLPVPVAPAPAAPVAEQPAPVVQEPAPVVAEPAPVLTAPAPTTTTRPAKKKKARTASVRRTYERRATCKTRKRTLRAGTAVRRKSGTCKVLRLRRL